MLPIKDCLDQLQRAMDVDPASIPDDHKPDDWRDKAKGVLSDLKDLALNESLQQKISANYFRICPEGRDPLSDVGSTLRDGRFNFRGYEGMLSIRALYFGKPPLTAFAERFQNERIFEEQQLKLKPHRIHEYLIELDKILVLDTDDQVEAIGLRSAVIRNEWSYFNVDYDLPAPPQVLGHIARTVGFNGIVYRSSRFTFGTNLVLFTENLDTFNPTKISEKEVDLSQWLANLRKSP